NIIKTSYRPFTKKYMYYDHQIVEQPGRYENFFGTENLAIAVVGRGASREFSALVTNLIPNMHYMDTCQVFYLKNNQDNEQNNLLFENQSNINNLINDKLGLSDEEIFYYVYAILNSPEYKSKYS